MKITMNESKLRNILKECLVQMNKYKQDQDQEYRMTVAKLKSVLAATGKPPPPNKGPELSKERRAKGYSMTGFNPDMEC